MKITNVRINGMKNPIGFSFHFVKVSWKVEEFTDQYQSMAEIQVSEAEDFDTIQYKKTGKELRSIGEKLEIELKPHTTYYVRVCVTGDHGEKAVSEKCRFQTAKMDEPWIADFIGMEDADTYHPVFFQTFELEKKVKKAQIYVTGLGVYEAFLNGKKIGDDYLAPFCNDYRFGIQYQTYDITDDLNEENIIEIMTGNGWYKGRFGLNGKVAVYGDRFAAIAELHITFTDGSRRVISTDETWKYRGSDIEMSDIYDGEVYHHMLWSGRENPEKQVVIMNLEKGKLKERYSLPVVKKEEIPVKEIIRTPKGEVVLDMGQNFTGYMEFESKLPRNTKATLDFGEILQEGNFYRENYRTAKSSFTYVSDGREEVVRPHFTFFGFRYVRVTGWVGELDIRDFHGVVVYSDLDTTLSMNSSSAMLNQLASNSMWGQRSNFLDIPTDCPQRDERLGWTGDAQVFAPTASFQMDTRAFYRKFLYDLKLDQAEHEGAICNYIPNIEQQTNGVSVWGDVATFVPMTLYECFGDEDDLALYYPMMKEWVDYMIRQIKEKGKGKLWDFGFHFGDWLAQDGMTPQSMKGGTDEFLIASAYYYGSLCKVVKAAEILGSEEDRACYKAIAEEVYQAILDEYFSANGRLTIDTQTGYLVCLRFGIFVDKERLIQGMKIRLKKDCYKIKGGFVGATMMCQVMAENDMEDLAYHILFQEGFPGWMHCIKLGATTIWERWNSVLDSGKLSGTRMNSLNHYAYGSVMEYVYRYIAGIHELEPGFTKVKFAPQLNSKLKYMECTYDSVSGKYTSAWNINQDGTITVHYEVPFNCSAIAVLPGTEQELELQPGSLDYSYRPEKDYRKLYTMDSRLEELKEDSRALEILRKQLPMALAIIENEDIEFMMMSFHELQFLAFRGFHSANVQQAMKELSKLEMEE